MQLSWNESLWWLPLMLLVSSGIAYGLYAADLRRKNTLFSRPVAIVLFSLRTLLLFGLMVLLLHPSLQSRKTQAIKPMLALITDNSLSIRNGHQGKDTLIALELKNNLREKLSGKFEVVEYTVGGSLQPNRQPGFNEPSTNLADAIKSLSGKQASKNLHAGILLSDGLYNEGSNPLFEASGSDRRFYSVMLGDTLTRKDVSIERVLANSICYKGDQVQIAATIQAEAAPGSRLLVKLEEIRNGKTRVLDQQTLVAEGNSYVKNIQNLIDAGEPGLLELRYSVQPISGEWTLKNNQQQVLLEVLDNRQKILLAGYSPHPDLGALKQALQNNKNFDVQLVLGNEVLKENPNVYSLIILHQLPSANFPATSFLQALNQSKVPSLFILGSQSAMQYPYGCASVQAGFNQYNQAQPSFNPNFTAFQLPDELEAFSQSLPPLTCGFGSYEAYDPAGVLCFQKINQVVTDYPLIACCNRGNARQGVILGEGLWRWRMQDQKKNGNTRLFESLMNAMVQYLAAKDDPRPFRVKPAKRIFGENESVTFEAELYNESRVAVTTPEISLKLQSADGRNSLEYRFSKGDVSYALDCGFLKPGNYRYEASTSLGGRAMKATGELVVSQLNLEFSRSTADHGLLSELAGRTGGFAVYPNQADRIVDSLLQDPLAASIMTDTIETSPLIDFKWFFALLCLFLFFEWGLRKWSGTY